MPPPHPAEWTKLTHHRTTSYALRGRRCWQQLEQPEHWPAMSKAQHLESMEAADDPSSPCAAASSSQQCSPHPSLVVTTHATRRRWLRRFEARRPAAAAASPPAPDARRERRDVVELDPPADPRTRAPRTCGASEPALELLLSLLVLVHVDSCSCSCGVQLRGAAVGPLVSTRTEVHSW